jgi:signal transduction histidine kinase
MKFSDDGVGVAATELSKLFESFYRTDPARANVSKGSGLGLAIVWQIVTALQGQVWAEPSEERGLTICILLPLAEEEAT